MAECKADAVRVPARLVIDPGLYGRRAETDCVRRFGGQVLYFDIPRMLKYKT